MIRLSSRSLRVLSEAVRLFWSVADRYAWRRLALALAAVSAGALLAAMAPLALKILIDALDTHATTSVVASLAFVAAYASAQCFSRCATELRVMLHGHAEQRVRRRIAERLFAHIVRMPMRFHLERKLGAVGETIEQGLKGYELLLQHLVYTLVPVCVEFVAVAIVLIQLQHAKYLAILAVSSIAYAAAFHRWASKVYEPAALASQAHIESHGVLMDSLGAHELVKYFDAESAVCRKYDLALGRTESAWRRFFDEYGVNGVVTALIFGASLALSLAVGVKDVRGGVMTAGEFVLVNAYVIRLVQPLEMIGLAIRDISQGLAFLTSMLSLLQERAEVTCDPGQPAFHPTTSAELAFEHVSFSYQQDRPILNDVSFKVVRGTCVAIVGVSGSGKSSLIRLLFRLYEPGSGRITLDGVPLQDLSLSTVRRAIAIVPQDTVLFHDTIASNIAVGRQTATRAEIEEAARMASLHDFILALPEGYDTVVGERGMKLSGGERQRVAIARAALKRPRIFVCDEATSSLDSRSEASIMRNLVALANQCTTLVIAHRLSTIVHADEIVVMHAGVVVERGTHVELLESNGYYAGLWGAQQARKDASAKPAGCTLPS